MIYFAKRNLKLFFKDKVAVSCSLIGLLVVLGLYLVFLGDALLSGLKDLDQAKFLIDSWLMAGVLAVVSITTSMGAFGIMVEDKYNGIIKDFIASPISNKGIIGGYTISAIIVGIIMSLITLFLFGLYVFITGGQILSFYQIIKSLH